MVKWCAMHVINLGICPLSCGSTMRVLLDHYPTVWSGDVINNHNDRLAIAYELFRAWTRERKIQYLASHDQILNRWLMPIINRFDVCWFMSVWFLIFFLQGCSRLYICICICSGSTWAVLQTPGTPSLDLQPNDWHHTSTLTLNSKRRLGMYLWTYKFETHFIETPFLNTVFGLYSCWLAHEICFFGKPKLTRQGWSLDGLLMS